MADRAQIHQTAIVEDGARVGPGTAIWDGAHLRSGAVVGRDCIIGEKSYIAYDVKVGDRCKLNACVYVCAGVTLEDGVMIAAHTVFTNDPQPRATTPDLLALRPSAPGDHTRHTLVREGASVGANCTIAPGVTLGSWCMVGMGSVVTRDVAEHTLVQGNPARVAGKVCACGEVVARVDQHGALPAGPHVCRCGRTTP